MNSRLKYSIIILALLFSYSVFSQNNDTIGNNNNLKQRMSFDLGLNYFSAIISKHNSNSDMIVKRINIPGITVGF